MRKYDDLASRLRHRGEVWTMEASNQKDELGQYPVREARVGTYWMEVSPQTGSLLSGRIADTQISRTTHKITMRFRRNIRPEMWVIVDGQRYDILYVLDPYLAHETTELFCEVRNDGERAV